VGYTRELNKGMLSGAFVTFGCWTIRSKTNGKFDFGRGIPAGSYVIWARKDGYKDYSKSIKISGGVKSFLFINMEPSN
jgi:hypothetical protein